MSEHQYMLTASIGTVLKPARIGSRVRPVNGARQERPPGSGRAAFRGAGVLCLCLLGAALVLGGAAGCAVDDPDYCETTDFCTGKNGPGYDCHPIRHICLQITPGSDCLEDKNCSDTRDRPRCDIRTNKCVGCVVDDSNDTSCSTLSPGSKCAPSPGGGTHCAECAVNLDCKDAAKPICDTSSGLCRPCSTHKDCEGKLICDTGSVCEDSLVCILAEYGQPDKAGHCAMNGSDQKNRVIYVHDQAACRDDDTNKNTGFPGTTFEQPFCAIQQAVDAAKTGGQQYIRVLGPGGIGKEGYTAPSPYMMLKLTFIGAPGKGYAENAKLGVRSIAFHMQEPGDITIDQFDMNQITHGYGLISCSNFNLNSSAKLRLFRSKLRGATPVQPMAFDPAIDISNCETILDGNQIGVAHKSDVQDNTKTAFFVGIRLAHNLGRDINYTIQNNVIAGNINTGLELYFEQGAARTNSKALIQFNTIYGNGRDTGMGSQQGVFCMGNSSKNKARLSNNIIFNNGRTSSKSQVAYPEFCTFYNTVIGRDDMGGIVGSILKNVELNEDFAPISTDDACIDKALLESGTLDSIPKYDIVGTPRPQPAGGPADIGAYELASGVN